MHEVLAKSGVDPTRARTLLQLMLRDKRLVRVSDELVFHASAMQSLRALLAQKKGSRFAVPEFKDWTGVSRKYAIPLARIPGSRTDHAAGWGFEGRSVISGLDSMAKKRRI